MSVCSSWLSEIARLFRAMRISLRLMFQPKSFRSGWVKLKVSVLPNRGLMVWKLRLESFLLEFKDRPSEPPPGIVSLSSTV